MPTERWIAPDQPATPPEAEQARTLRPSVLDEYVGQAELVERLTIAIEASRARDEPVEHLLLHGPPGLGKTTLAHVVAHEMGSKVHLTSGPALTKGADLVGALTRLDPGDVLFIDEIHRMPVAVEEFIYPAMEDGRIDVAVDAGLHGRTVRLAIKPFTLIGATTRAGLLSAPLRSRFGMVHHLRYYPDADLERILERSRSLLAIDAKPGALATIAARSRGTPRIANRLLRRVRDYAQVRAGGRLDTTTVNEALALEGVDERGMDELDRLYLHAIGTTYAGGPVGLEAVAATLGEDGGTLEDVVEPYLLQIGLLARTRRGRMLTPEGARLVGVDPPEVPTDPTDA